MSTPETANQQPETANQYEDRLIALLNIFGTQYASYTTLLWQVPVLSLTAQAFLMTIALGNGGKPARITASALSMTIAVASYFLMHDQRGHAINNGELAKRISGRMLTLQEFSKEIEEDDGVPKATNAEDIWTWHGKFKYIRITGENWYSITGAGRTYFIWQACMSIFFFVGIGIIISSLWQLIPAVLIAAAFGVLALTKVIIKDRRLRKKEKEEKEESEKV